MAKQPDAQVPEGTEVTMIKVTKVHLLEGNPRKGELDLIKESIRFNGFITPIVVRKSDMTVLAGNHRVMAARELDIAKVPAVIVDLDDETATRFMLADNRASDMADYDEQALGTILKQFLDENGRATDALKGTAYNSRAADKAIARAVWDQMTEEDEKAATSGKSSRKTRRKDGVEMHATPKDRQSIIEKLGRRSIMLSIPVKGHEGFANGMAAAREWANVETNEEAIVAMMRELEFLTDDYELGL